MEELRVEWLNSRNESIRLAVKRLRMMKQDILYKNPRAARVSGEMIAVFLKQAFIEDLASQHMAENKPR